MSDTPLPTADEQLSDELLRRIACGLDSFDHDTGTAAAQELLLLRSRSAERREWRPISEAPKDGTVVDLWCIAPGIAALDAGRTTDCWFADGQWWRYDDQWGGDQCRSAVHNATHWQPLPSPPSKTPAAPKEHEVMK